MNYIFILISYLLGSIPFGLLFGRMAGVDIRKSGSGNIGATNVGRLLGRKLGILTLFADIGKAMLPMLLLGWLLRNSGDPVNREFWVAMSGLAAFLGHLFPVYLKFKGGKGVATAVGVFLLLEPLAVLIGLAAFVVVVYVWGFVSLGSLCATALLPLGIWLLQGPEMHIGLAAAMAILVWIKHGENIKRLVNRTEKSWKKAEEKAG